MITKPTLRCRPGFAKYSDINRESFPTQASGERQWWQPQPEPHPPPLGMLIGADEPAEDDDAAPPPTLANTDSRRTAPS